jgi:STAS-like domain of unknown function (DUF4325)
MTQVATQNIVYNIAKQFSVYPGGRDRNKGEYSGQEFREDVLTPLLESNKEVTIELDGVFTYGSSFLEEAFGGLIRHGVVTYKDFMKRIHFLTEKQYLTDQISYLLELSERSRVAQSKSF